MKKGIAAVCLSLLLTALSSLGAGENLILVKDGNPGSTRIQMSYDPSAQEFQAAKELNHYIRKISGAHVPWQVQAPAFQRVLGKDPDFTEITLATLENGKYLLPEAVKEKLSKAESPQAFYIRTDGSRILIAGRSPIGVLYGAYTFIEKYLGVRWFHAGPEGEYCPATGTLSVPAIDDFESPAIERRMIGAWRGSLTPWSVDDHNRWNRRNKMQYASPQPAGMSREALDLALCGDEKPTGGGHVTFEQAVPQKLFAEHPEYFPLQGGKRVCKARSQRCLGNPDVQKMVVDFGVSLAEYNTLFGVGFHDSTDGWCECAECRKLGTYNGVYKLNTAAHRFAAKMTSEILKRNPGAGGQRILIYSDFRDPLDDPSVRYDGRVKALYCSHQRCYVHPLDDQSGSCNRKYYRELLAWRKHCPNLGIYDYYAYASSPYAPMEYTLARDLKLYRKLGLKSFYDDCTNKNLPMPSSNWQFYYVLAKMSWNAELDVEQLMDETYTLYYGKASAPMKRYHALRRELWESAPGHASYGGPCRIGYCLTVEGAEQRLLNFLAEAEKLAGNDGVLKKRIAMDRDFLTRFWIAEAAKIKKLMSGQKDIPVVRADSKITIDGELNEDVWRRAPLVAGFRTPDGSQPVEATRVKVAYDSGHWYFAIEAMTEHAWSPLKAEAKERDSAVYSDDSVEIFLMPPDGDYHHIAVNSLGTVYDAKIRDVAYESGAEVRAKVLKDRYVIEMKVPVAPMGRKIEDGQVWRMHFYRNCRNLQPPKVSEGSSPDGTPPHEQTRFRRAVIGRSAIRNGEFTRLRDVPPSQQKNLDGRQFPFGWNGVGARMITENGKNSVLVHNVIYSLMTVPREENGYVIRGEVTASGKGQMKITVSSCIRKPDDKRGFGHENRRVVLDAALKEEPAAYPFRFEFAPYENGYLYINAPDAKIDSVSASMTAK